MPFNSMPFNKPSNQQSTDADFEAELPADFAALGEQLQCDADRLSRVYPPSAPPALLAALAVRPAPHVGGRKRLVAVASAALVLLTVSLVVAIRAPGILPLTSSAPEAESSSNPRPSNPRPSDVAISAAAPGGNVQPVQVTPVSLRPAILDLNGPQLEGLLDLWNEQPEKRASVSF